MKKILILFNACILILASYGALNAGIKIDDIRTNIEGIKEDLNDVKKDPDASSDLHDRIQVLISKLEQSQQKMEQRKAQRQNWKKGHGGKCHHHKKGHGKRGHKRKNIDEKIKNIKSDIADIDAILKDSKLDDKMRSDLDQLKMTLKKVQEQLENFKSMKGKRHHEGKGHRKGRGGCRHN
jgi:chromosome segregation ATPase